MSTKDKLAEGLNKELGKQSQAAALMGKTASDAAAPEAPKTHAEKKQESLSEAARKIAELEKALAAKDEKIKALQDEAEPKRAKVNFAIRPSRYKAFCDIAEKKDMTQGGLFEWLIENEYGVVFAGKALPSAEDAGEWLDARGRKRK